MKSLEYKQKYNALIDELHGALVINSKGGL